MNRLPHIFDALLTEPWLIKPSMHATITQIVRAHALGGMAELEQHMKAAEFPAAGKDPAIRIEGSTAIIEVEGVLIRKFSRNMRSSGITSTDVLERTILEAADNDAIKAIVLSVDSPGGMSAGIPEAAAAVRYAKGRKPVMAYADGQMDSAAYWLASQADGIYATPSADIGSIGAYIAFLDESRAYELNGFEMEVFKSGRFKGMGMSGTSLTDEQRAMLQARVDKSAAEFKATVRAARGMISEELMQGQSMSAHEALTGKLIDAISDLRTTIRDAERMIGRSR